MNFPRIFQLTFFFTAMIYDYTVANGYYNEIMSNSDVESLDWKQIESIYRPIYVSLLDDAFPKTMEAFDFLANGKNFQIFPPFILISSINR